MKKLFISCPMKGRTEENIRKSMEQKGWCRVVEIRNYDENTQIEPIENDRVYINRQSLKLLDEYIEIGSVYEFRRLKKESDEYFLKWLEYKKLEEQGLLLRLPCKVGDTAYCLSRTYLTNVDKWIHEIVEVEVDSFVLDTKLLANVSIHIRGDRFGKTLTPYKSLFFTKEEAEQALAEMEK